MKRRRCMVLVTLAALVTTTAVLVYVLKADVVPYARAQDAPPGSTTGRLPDPAPEPDEAGDDPAVLYDATDLPEPVQRLLRAIILAARTGDIDAMRPVLESNELKPMVAAAHIDDPIAFWRKRSVDGSGRDILAAMLNMLDTGFVLTGEGHDAMYVWPFFAEVDLGALDPEQQVEFYRTVPPRLAKAMKDKGEYTYYRLGISPEGVWHYFIR